jgi:hypothetical protein
VYRIILPEAKSRVSFEDPLSMIRYVDQLNDKGIKWELKIEDYGNELENVPAAPFRQPEGVR